MKTLRKQLLPLFFSLSISISLSSCQAITHLAEWAIGHPREVVMAIDITIEIGDYIVEKIEGSTLGQIVEGYFDSLFADVSDVLSDATKGAIIENSNDPTGLTGRKAFDAKFVVQRHREAKFKTEFIVVKKEDLTYVRASRDSSAKWEMTKMSLDLVKTRLNAAAVQISLKSFGINPGRVDGIWGERTKEAIGEFQKKQGLPMTREIDKETEKLLLGEE
jgi:hypothetical protein